MTERQRKFIDNYVMTGVGAESARLAGYAPKDAAVAASKLLADKQIAREIRRRLDEVHNERTATVKEVLERVTAILRGEEIEETAVVVGVGKGARIEKVQIPARISDRLQAAKILLKAIEASGKSEEKVTAIEIVDAGGTNANES